MAQVIRYVDPDAGGANNGTSWTDAYTSLSAWNTNEATDLVTDGDYHTCYCRSSGGTADSTAGAGVGGGWTTDATHYVEIIGSDFPSDGIYDATKYRVTGTNVQCFGVNANYVRVHNLQIVATESGVGATYGIRISSIAAGGSDIRIDSCIVKGVCSGTGAASGIEVQDTDTTCSIYNCTVYDSVSGADADFRGIYCNITGTVNIYNCTVYNCYCGIRRNVLGTVSVYNTAVGNCTDDFSGTFSTVDYCCSDDGDGTNGQGPSDGNWANEFNDAGNGNFTLLSGGNCVGNGTDNPGAGLYSDDITGTARTSTWDIGADEYTVGGAAGQFMTGRKYW